jgi:hypothetical protein
MDDDIDVEQSIAQNDPDGWVRNWEPKPEKRVPLNDDRFHKYQIDASISNLIADADRVGIPEAEVLDIFSEKLPDRKDEAAQELRRRLAALYQRVEHRQSKPRYKLQHYLMIFDKLKALDKRFDELNKYVTKTEELLRETNYKEDSALTVEFLRGKIEIWRINVTKELQEFEEYMERMGGDNMYEDPHDYETNIRNLKRFYDEYFERRDAAEDTLTRFLPWIKSLESQLRCFNRALKIVKFIPPDSWQGTHGSLTLNDVEIEELSKKHGGFLGERWVEKILDSLGWSRQVDINQLARVISKTGKVGKPQAQAKLVKRKLRGLRPAGEAEVDYKVITATENHVKDGTARQVGDEIFGFVQGRTKFDTLSFLEFWHIKSRIDDVVTQLKKELGHNPSAEEVAHEMGLQESMIWQFMG